eukprot:Rmarinus@m.25858
MFRRFSTNGGAVCIGCKKKFGLFTKARLCSCCELSYCEDCLKNFIAHEKTNYQIEEAVCPMCFSPKVDSVSCPPTTGGQVKVTGFRFGKKQGDLKVVVGGVEKKVTLVSANSNFIFTVGAGSGLGVPLEVHRAGAPPAHATVNYAAPVVSEIESPPTAGGPVLITGSNFGTNAADVKIAVADVIEGYKEKGNELRWEIMESVDVEMATPHTALRVTWGPGTGKKLVRVTVAHQASRHPAEFFYKAPRVKAIVLGDLGELVVKGANFGASEDGLAVSIDGIPCENVVPKGDHREISVSLPADAKDRVPMNGSRALKVSVTVGGQTDTRSLTPTAAVDDLPVTPQMNQISAGGVAPMATPARMTIPKELLTPVQLYEQLFPDNEAEGCRRRRASSRHGSFGLEGLGITNLGMVMPAQELRWRDLRERAYRPPRPEPVRNKYWFLDPNADFVPKEAFDARLAEFKKDEDLNAFTVVDPAQRTDACGHVPWTDATSCVGCAAKYTALTRPHHCRACGRSFCATCVSQRKSVSGWPDQQRVCKT